MSDQRLAGDLPSLLAQLELVTGRAAQVWADTLSLPDDPPGAGIRTRTIQMWLEAEDDWHRDPDREAQVLAIVGAIVSVVGVVSGIGGAVQSVQGAVKAVG